MKQNILLAVLLPFLCGLILFSVIMNNKIIQKQKTNGIQISDIERAAFDPQRNKYMFDMVKDPATGRIPDGVFDKAYQQAMNAPEKATLSPNENNTYLVGGNLSAGGRTRVVAYDKRYNGTTNQVIVAGAVSGGIMRSADGGATWTRVGATNQIHNVHWIVQDTTPGRQDRWFAGGGEHWGNSSSENGAVFMGDGMYRSTDNGVTWLKLPLNIASISGSGTAVPERFDHPFDFVHKIALNPINGHLYVGCHRRLIRSTDFGLNWEVVFVGTQPSTASAGTVDVTFNTAGKVFIAVNGGNNDFAIRGVWTSNTGNSGSFTRIAGGSVLGVDSVAGWRGNAFDGEDVGGGQIVYTSKRILLALAPSNQNIMYVTYENGLDHSVDGVPEVDFYKVDLITNTWTNFSANMPDLPGGVANVDPFLTQGGYDFHLNVKPNDPNFVILGGVNLFRSTDGFASTANTTWIGGYANQNNGGLYLNQHPDQHAIAFRPDNPNEAISASDGGLSKTTNINAGTVAWSMVENYQTFQYYYVAIDPDAGRNNFIGGLQDNGTFLRDRNGVVGTTTNDSNRHRSIFGGDGVSVGIGPNVAGQQRVFFGTQVGSAFRKTLTGTFPVTVFVSDRIAPTGYGLTANGSGFGEFVTNFKLNPSNAEDLYYVNFNRLFRTITASTVTVSTGWEELTGVGNAVDITNNASNGRYVRSLAFSWGPYQPSHALYIGTTDSRIFRIDNPRNVAAATAPINISIPGLPAGANIQDIAVNPNNDNEIMAVISNYEVSNVNVVSVWWTNNAKAATPTWRNAEGDFFTSVSPRSCAIVVKKDAGNNPVTEYYIGTSVGLFSAVNIGPTLIGAGSVTWFREGGTVLGLPVVQSLAYRPSDNVLLVGTHGNGMYFTYLGIPNYTPNGATAVSNQILNDKNFISKVLPTISSGNIEYRIGNLFATKRMNVQLYSIAGKEVYRNSTGYQNGSIDISKFSKGMYVLSITSDDNKYKHLQKVLRQ